MSVRTRLRRVAEELVMSSPFGSTHAARSSIRRGFTTLEARTLWRGRAISHIAFGAVRLKRLARLLANGDAAARSRFADALLAASAKAQSKFRSAGLQSYVDVSVSVTAVRVFAAYLAAEPVFSGEPMAVTRLLLEHEPDSRAALLAHAEMLLDEARAKEATPFIRRALRIQSVCPTAQQLLARAVEGTDYDLRDKFCPMPFTHLSTSFQGDAFVCCCPAWVPYAVGNVLDAQTAEAVWNSEKAVEIRRSIHDGDFRYCSRTLCSYIAAKNLPLKSEVTDPVLRRYIDERTTVVPEAPAMVQMNHDQSCNLACPSCRTGIITAGPEEQRTYLDAADRVLLPLLRNVDGMTYISGGGEAFSSTHYRKILAALNRRDYPGLHVFLITNAQLLNAKRWSEFPDLPEMIGNLSVSIDAARAETYERLRRPGKWPVLIDNLQLMAEMRAAGKIRRLQINFVVQADNFRELPEFIALGDRFGVDSFWLQRLTNYGAFAEPVFAKSDVTVPSHPDHAELLSILRSPVLKDPRVDMEMLMPLLREFVDADLALRGLRTRAREELLGTAPRRISEA
jgi:pyruvate-formate lyase-activating enzyme